MLSAIRLILSAIRVYADEAACGRMQRPAHRVLASEASGSGALVCDGTGAGTGPASLVS